MSQRLPSLKALRAFEAAGRHLSFTHAAEELHVTPAAVGHQVKVLEEDLGVQLFQRKNRAIVLTRAGHALLPGLSEVFYELVETVEAFRRRDGSRPLTVSAPPSFAAGWLLPRLQRFRELHPDIEIRIDANNRVVDLNIEDVDVGLRYGRGGYPGMRVDSLLSEEVFPVCSPRIADGPAPLAEPRDLAAHTLLHVEGHASADYWPDWPMWLQSAGVTEIDATRGIRLTQTSHALQLAADGQGVALGSRVLAGNALADGRLVRPFATAFPVSFAYYMVCPEAIADRPRVTAFREWVMAEARDDERRGSEERVGIRQSR